MKFLKDIPVLNGVKVLVRVDFNVPIKNGLVVDDFRIRSAMPTIEYLCSKKAKVILLAHLEGNDGQNPSLEPAAVQLNKLGIETSFVKDMKNAHTTIEEGMLDGQCVLLENLRFFEGEKKNDSKFAQELASLGDIYVNDAFSVSHRKHASIVGIPELLPSYAGLQFQSEIENLSKAFDPKHPFLFILGGAKFETKLPLLDKFLNIADMIFVGGALANDLVKAKGLEVGKSLVSSDPNLDLSKFVSNSKILMPLDIITKNKNVRLISEIGKDEAVADDGPKTLELLAEKINQAEFILWNGPLGMYENGFTGPTQDLAKMICNRTSAGATSILGGGDTLAAVATLGLAHKISFMSTGGGAMLDFLGEGTLPGIEALEKSQ